MVDSTRQSRPVFALTLVLAMVLAAGVFYAVVRAGRSGPDPLPMRRPGLDKRGAPPAVPEQSPIELGKRIAGTGAPSDIPGAWPGFRGPNGDNLCPEAGPLTRQWDETGPPSRWSIELGEGYAGAAVQDGRVYILDYDMVGKADALRCLSLADGQEIWRFTYPVKVKRNHGMSRTVPAVTGGYVVSLGPKCHVVCLDSDTGEFRWGIDLVKDYGTTVPEWYAGQCPLIDGERVILAPGGDSLMIAVELATGQVAWKTPNPRDWKMTHASIVPMEFGGERFYVYCGSGGVAGIGATDGRLRWETDEWKIPIATIPSPLPVGDGRIFLTGGYNTGSLMLQLKRVDDRIVAEPVFRLKATEFGATQHTPVLYRNHIYGVRADGQLCCLDLAGRVLWSSGNQAKFGLGPFLIANDLILALKDDGQLTLAEATPTGYHPLAQARVLDGHDAWGPMALVSGRLLARDLTRMVCLDVAGEMR